MGEDLFPKGIIFSSRGQQAFSKIQIVTILGFVGFLTVSPNV